MLFNTAPVMELCMMMICIPYSSMWTSSRGGVQEEGSEPLDVQLQVLESVYTFAAGKLHTFKVGNHQAAAQASCL